MLSRADEYRYRDVQCETKATAASEAKKRANLTELARRWNELARQLDMLDEDY